MADDNEQQENALAAPPKSKMPIIMGGLVAVVAVVAVAAVLMMGQGPSEPKVIPPSEYQVPDKMYQLRDGSYLKLSFSIVVDSDKLATVTEILEKESPNRLPDGINMILGNKTRDDLISGTHKREAFVRELKKTLEERVFGEYNRRQTSAQDTVEIREVLISDFVTQPG